MWWLHLLLGIPAVLVGLEIVRALWPWPVTGRASALLAGALAYGVSWLPVHGHIMAAADMAAVVPLAIRYLRLASVYERARSADELLGQALLAWDAMTDRITRRRPHARQDPGTMLPPNVGKRIPSL